MNKLLNKSETDTDNEFNNHRFNIIKGKLEKALYDDKVNEDKIKGYQTAIENLIRENHEFTKKIEDKEKEINILNYNRNENEVNQLKKNSDVRNDFLLDKVYEDNDWKEYLNKDEPKIFQELINPNIIIDIKNNDDNNITKATNDFEFKIKKSKLYTKAYIDLKNAGLINGWDYKRTEEARQWKNDLRFMHVVNHYFMHQLKRREGRWSWILIVISSIVAVVSILSLDNSQALLIIGYGVTIFSVLTSLIAAYIKKENYVERIKELDRYTQKVGKVMTQIKSVLSEKPWNRSTYQVFTERYQNEVNSLLSTPPPLSPSELKKTVYELTRFHPDQLIGVYPWYKLKIYDNMPYHSMTEYGLNILEAKWSNNCIRKCGFYLLCTGRIEHKARIKKKKAKEWFHDQNRDLICSLNIDDKNKLEPWELDNLQMPYCVTNRYKVRWFFFKYILPIPGQIIRIFCCRKIKFFYFIFGLLFYLLCSPLLLIFLIIETLYMFVLPCFLPEYSHFLYPEYHNAMIERKMVSKTLKIDEKILDKNLKKEDIIKGMSVRRNIHRVNELNNINRSVNFWNVDNNINNKKLSSKIELDHEKKKTDMYDKMWRESQKKIKTLQEKINNLELKNIEDQDELKERKAKENLIRSKLKSINAETSRDSKSKARSEEKLNIWCRNKIDCKNKHHVHTKEGIKPLILIYYTENNINNFYLKGKRYTNKFEILKDSKLLVTYFSSEKENLNLEKSDILIYKRIKNFTKPLYLQINFEIILYVCVCENDEVYFRNISKKIESGKKFTKINSFMKLNNNKTFIIYKKEIKFHECGNYYLRLRNNGDFFVMIEPKDIIAKHDDSDSNDENKKHSDEEVEIQRNLDGYQNEGEDDDIEEVENVEVNDKELESGKQDSNKDLEL
jgi:hypothetical protein